MYLVFYSPSAERAQLPAVEECRAAECHGEMAADQRHLQEVAGARVRQLFSMLLIRLQQN